MDEALRLDSRDSHAGRVLFSQERAATNPSPSGYQLVSVPITTGPLGIHTHFRKRTGFFFWTQIPAKRGSMSPSSRAETALSTPHSFRL